MEFNYYQGYELDDCSYIELSEKDKLILDACIWLVDNRSSIVKTSRNFCISKSYLHKHIHSTLKKRSFELYKCVVKQLKKNKVGNML